MTLRPWLFAFAFCLSAAAAQTAPRLRVLFLGDDDHHVPSQRAADAHRALAERGIDIFYTPHLADLTAPRLAAHDALLIYANHPTIPRQVERDLMAYVEGGGALIAVHCASYCFRNSPRYVELVGAQFERHGGGEFRAEVVAPEHELLRGYQGFSSWDETYVHTKHNAARTVLMVRREAGQPDEPWTWVREVQKGRVFYTASGHDARTWRNPGFHDLLTRGIRWACRRDVLAEPSPPPFSSSTPDTPVPDYQPGKRTQDQVHQNTMQNPLPPAASLQRMVVSPDLAVELFAAEPELRKPIALAFDARGRLFVAETLDYPNDRKDSDGSDRIRIVEDRDGDGRAEHFTTFAEGLSVPTSLCFTPHGLVVLQAPDVLLLRDTDGDDRADQRTVLFTGWGTGDTHAGPSNLRLAPDNWLWATVGYSGFSGKVLGEERRFGQAIWRMRLDAKGQLNGFEVMASTSNNTWGLGLSDDFYVFGSTANGNPGVHLAIPTRCYEQVPGFSPGVLPTIVDHDRYHPLAKVVRQVDFHGRYTAGAGAAVYTARALPPRFWNKAMLVCEPTGNLCGMFELRRDGAGFRARNAWNLLVSDDQWTAPIAAEVGPDGAVWVLDWYNFIVQHNPTPHGFATGRGNAYVTPLRDKVHGRVLRIRARDAQPAPRRDLVRADLAQCVELLRDDNQLWRLHAQQRLLAAGALDAALQAKLLAMVAQPSIDALGLDHGALHALWTLQGLGLCARADVREVALGALRHPAPSVRRAALMALSADGGGDAALRDAILTRGLLGDADLRIRLEALLALAATPRDEAAGRAVFAAAQVAEHQNDPLVSDALIVAAARHDAGFLAAMLAAWRPQGDGAVAKKPSEPVNLLANASFEDAAGDSVALWQVRTYSGRADHALDGEVARTGKRSLRIRSERGADSSFFLDVAVEPQRTYRLSGWVKTQGLRKRGGFGALFNVHGRGAEDGATPGLREGGDHDWQKQTLVFESGGDTRVSINCLYGGWGQSTGTAWFDDVELVAIDGGLSGRFGRIAGKVVHAYAARAPRESVVETLLSLRGAPGELTDAVLTGLLDGWPQGVSAPQLDAAAGASLGALANGFAEDARVKLLALADRWGQRAALKADVGALAQSLRVAVGDTSRGDDERVAAMRRLVVLDDSEASVAAIGGVLGAGTAPSVVAGAIETLGASGAPSVAGLLLGRYKDLAPAARTAAVNVLLKRPASTKALLDAVADGRVAAFAIPLANWQALERHPDAAIAELTKRVRGQRGSDRAAVLAKFLPLADRDEGDAARGRELFVANCALCHKVAGQGGTIGPDLEGIGARPRRDTLLAILDPNASVESNYVLWMLTQQDGTVLSGRLDAETRTTVEVLDLTGKRHVVPRDKIKSLQSLDTSLMPAGFESLGEQGILDLLAFLSASRGH